MEMPEINRVFGIFPPKYACYLISLFGLASGGVGIAGIVLFGVVEGLLLSHFDIKELDDVSKKIVLLTIGVTSMFLLVSNGLLFLGVIASSRDIVQVAKWISFGMCILIVAGCCGAPIFCFFLTDKCPLAYFSLMTTAFVYLVFTIFLDIWLYFVVVMYNLQVEL